MINEAAARELVDNAIKRGWIRSSTAPTDLVVVNREKRQESMARAQAVRLTKVAARKTTHIGTSKYYSADGRAVEAPN